MTNTTCECGDLEIINRAANLYFYKTLITDLFSIFIKALQLYGNYKYGNY